VTSANAIDVSDLTVRYGKRVAVDGLSLRVEAGSVVAVLGPNGAGKSTSLMAMAGGVLPAGGSLRLAGHDVVEDAMAARRATGFADQPPTLYDYFTVSEHLAFVAETRGDRDTDGHRALLERLGLAEIAGRMCRELSFGMRQRVGLAAALVGGVSVILLDETLNGLDPRAARLAREAVREAADAGAAVLMSTHLLGVAERLCDRILIMDRGKLCADKSGAELEELLAGGPGALEELYLSLVTDEQTR